MYTDTWMYLHDLHIEARDRLMRGARHYQHSSLNRSTLKQMVCQARYFNHLAVQAKRLSRLATSG